MGIEITVIRPSRVPRIRRGENNFPHSEITWPWAEWGEGACSSLARGLVQSAPKPACLLRTYTVTSVDSRISWICKARQLRASYSLNLRSRPLPPWLVPRIRYYIRFNPRGESWNVHERQKGIFFVSIFVNLNCTTGYRIFVEVKLIKLVTVRYYIN